MSNEKKIGIYFLVFGIFLCIISPKLLSQGMFMDGTIYASISRNLSQGLGSLWLPHFTNTRYPEFHEHPPLFFWIQGIFFKFFGDYIWVEKLFSFSTIIIQCYLIQKIWRFLSDFHSSWIPIALWLAFPIIQWTSTNNMLENLMMIFCLLSVYLFLYAQKKNKILNLILSGLMLLFGFFVKGPVALFPLVFPWAYSIFHQRKFSISLVLENSISSLTFLVFLLFVYFGFSEVKTNLDINFQRQVIRSISSIVTVNSRFTILLYLFSELAFPLGFVIILLFIKKFRRPIVPKISPDIYTFFITGLCGVLPFLISFKQSRFYIIPSLTFFALSFGLIVENLWIEDRLLKINIQRRYFNIFSGIILLFGIYSSIFHMGKIGRDINMINDLHNSANYIKKGTTIQCCAELKNNFGLEAYYERYLNASLDDQHKQNYILYSRDCKSDPPVDSLLTMKNKEYFLYTIK